MDGPEDDDFDGYLEDLDTDGKINKGLEYNHEDDEHNNTIDDEIPKFLGSGSGP